MSLPNFELKEIRKKYRIQQQEIARASGISSSRLSRIENGWEELTRPILEKLLLGFESLGIKDIPQILKEIINEKKLRSLQ